MRNRPRTATPAVQTYIEEKADDLDLPTGVPEENIGEPNPATERQEPELDDDSWLDELTPYQVEQEVPPQAQTPSEPQSGSGTSEPQSESGTAEQQKRLAELYANLNHIDEDVASEIDDKFLAPIRAEVNELKALRQQEQQQRQSQLIANANGKIIAKHPKAEKILRSQQFKDFVNADSDPYSTEQVFDRVLRAYYSGDGDYVLRKLDAFVGNRGKPKPPVGVEPHQGSGGNNVGNVSAKRPMTEAEYLAKRQAIKAAPRGTYPPNALKQLAEEYQLSRG